MVTPERPPPAKRETDSRLHQDADAPVVAVSGRIGPTEIGNLCARMRELFSDPDVRTVVVDVSLVAEPDVGALDALARLHLTARRLGRDIRIRHTCRQLQELAAFAGLREILLSVDDEAGAELGPT